MAKKVKLPTDINQKAKTILDIVTGEFLEPEDTKNPAAVALGKLGGLKGGKARADKLTPDRRADIARKAAQSRWKKEG